MVLNEGPVLIPDFSKLDALWLTFKLLEIILQDYAITRFP